MKKILVLGLLILAGCAKVDEKVVYQKEAAANPTVTTQPVPNVTVIVDNSNSNQANGGSVSNSGNSSNENNSSGGSSSATGGSSSNNNSATGGSGGTSTSNGGNSSSNSSNTNSNSSNSSATNSNSVDLDLDIDTQQDVNVENDQELNAALQSGRAYVSGNGKCKRNEVKKQRNNKCVCVKPARKTGLKCNLYDLSATRPNTLLNFSTMTPVYKFVIDKLDITDRDWAGGFPKIANTTVRNQYLEWYGIRCTGKLKTTTAGAHTFTLTADDGAKFYINNVLVVDNDGLHAVQSRTNTVNLHRGQNNVMIDYYQGPRVRIALVLEMAVGSNPKQIIDTSLFSR